VDVGVIVGKNAVSSRSYLLMVSQSGADVGKANFILMTPGGSPTGRADSTTLVNDNQYHHVAAVLDPTENVIRIYVDGVLEGTGTPGAFNADSSGPLRIGNQETTRYFDGIIDEVRIYNRALSSDEIKAIYLSGVR